MATSLVVNGVSYLYPDTGDQSWGTVASAWAAAVTSGMLQKAGGTFALTADVNFGGTFGLLSKYFTSTTAAAASTGQVRLASADSISWRNNANSADLALAKNSSDQLTFGGNVLFPWTTKGDLLVFNGTTGVRLAAGSDGQVLSALAAASTGLTWISPLTNPMTTLGDIIVGGASGAATRLAGDTSNAKRWLRSQSSAGVAGTPAWDQPAFTDLSGSVQASQMPAHTGDVTSSAGSVALTIAANAVTNAKAAQMAANTIKGNNTGSTANAADLTVTQTKALLNSVPTVQKFTSGSGTYTTPAGVLYIRVRMLGGGGGGGAAGAGTNGNAGSNGGDTTFGTSLLVAHGATGGSASGNLQTGGGGTASLGTGPLGIALTGASGGGQGSLSTASNFAAGGSGGVSPFGGAGASGQANQPGGAAVANTGSGGGGGGGPSGGNPGGGGGAGGFVDAIITSPAASYSYGVGAGGAGGTIGTGTVAGGAGGSGFIEVTEFYQ